MPEEEVNPNFTAWYEKEDSEISDAPGRGKAYLRKIIETDKGAIEETIWKYEVADYREVPDPHEIGMSFGGGRYKLIVNRWNASGKKIKTATSDPFDLSDSYNKYCKEHVVEDLPKADVVESPAVSGVNANDIALAVAQGVAGAVTGLVEGLKPHVPSLYNAIKPEPVDPDPFGVMEKATVSMHKLIDLNMKKTSESANNFISQFMESQADRINYISNQNSETEVDSEPEEAGDSVMGKLFNMATALLAKKIPEILESDSENAKAIVQGLASNPLVSQIVSSPRVKMEVGQWVLDAFGEEAYNTLESIINSIS